MASPLAELLARATSSASRDTGDPFRLEDSAPPRATVQFGEWGHQRRGRRERSVAGVVRSLTQAPESERSVRRGVQGGRRPLVGHLDQHEQTDQLPSKGRPVAEGGPITHRLPKRVGDLVPPILVASYSATGRPR